MKLREYQNDALICIRDKYAKGIKRVLLHLSTGAGKTVIFCEIFKGLAEKGKHGIMVVRGKALVDQASRRLFREGVEHGVLQANHWNYKPNVLIQVCSIDTLHRRKLVPSADMVVIDEAHLACSDSFKWLVANYPDAFFLPVTATPFVRTGLRHIAEDVVRPISFANLVALGYLSSPKYFAPTKLDLSDVRIKNHEYEEHDLEIAVTKPNIYGDIIRYYLEKLNGLATLCFAVSVNHSKALVENFKANGISAEHMDADTPDTERTNMLSRLEKGETQVICNVGVLSTGVDLPFLRGIIMSRPTKSYNLYIQQMGRGTRPFDGKQNFIVLDHAMNIAEHGFMEDDPECNLDGEPARTPSVTICEACFVAFNSRLHRGVCPECGYKKPIEDRPTKERKVIVASEIDLREITVDQLTPNERLKVNKAIWRLCKTAALKRYKPGWVYHKIKEQFGVKIANDKWEEIQCQIQSTIQTSY